MTCVERRDIVFPVPEYSGGAAAEMSRESHASSAAEKLKGKTSGVDAHNQILRIRSEDSHLGEDIGEGILSWKYRFGVTQLMVLSRPILPASPLSGKNS